jgi:hypothetical protein
MGWFSRLSEVLIEPLTSSESESRVTVDVDGLVGVTGHADRAAHPQLDGRCAPPPHRRSRREPPSISVLPRTSHAITD